MNQFIEQSCFTEYTLPTLHSYVNNFPLEMWNQSIFFRDTCEWKICIHNY